VSDRSLDKLGTNYVGLESENLVANSVMSFASSGIGHEVAERCLQEIRTNFRGDIWIHNGPGLITRVLLNMFNTIQVSYCLTKR
jgi:lactosylceramide 4-alpha-galactosyltransferase